MLSKALQFIANFLNKELKMQYGIDYNPVLVSSLINPDGSIAENIENKIIVSVINIEQETTVKSMNQYKSDGNNNYAKAPLPLYLNLYLLISANYDSSNYMESLKMLSSVIGVFQANTYFTNDVNVDMPASLDKLTLEILNMPINELSHIWSGIGAKYVPSIIYKVRMITIDENQVKSEAAGIAGLHGTPSLK